MMEAIAYCRVSTEEQAKEGVSLDAQEARIRAYCTMAGLTLVAVIRDEGVSGADLLAARPGGAVLLRTIGRREAQHVVAVRLDRVFRDAVDCLGTVKAWKKASVSVHFVDLGGAALDTSSAMGKFFLNIMAAVAEMERNLIAERVSAAIQHKKAQRQAYGPTPYGFDRLGDGLIPNAAEQAVIRQMHRWRRAGRTLAWIADELTRRDIPAKRRGRWNAYGVRYILRNPLHGEVA
jgi:DNA invertase Pin-like site-specific DNA recombinase